MSSVKYGLYVLVLVVIFKGLHSDMFCLNCEDIPIARDCSTVKKCGGNEVCFHEQVVSQSGRITRKLGCKDSLKCATGLIGKRTLQRKANGDVTICSECCTSTTGFCQTTLCNDIDYSTNASICFNCDAQKATDECNRIVQCGRDEVCSEQLAKTAVQSDSLRSTTCFSRLACQSVMQQLHLTNQGGRRRANVGQSQHCFNCCEGNLCNTKCDFNYATTTLGPAVTGGNTVGSTTPAACTDHTSASTCKLAAAIICSNHTKAINAGCEHYCGYC